MFGGMTSGGSGEGIGDVFGGALGFLGGFVSDVLGSVGAPGLGDVVKAVNTGDFGEGEDSLFYVLRSGSGEVKALDSLGEFWNDVADEDGDLVDIILSGNVSLSVERAGDLVNDESLMSDPGLFSYVTGFIGDVPGEDLGDVENVLVARDQDGALLGVYRGEFTPEDLGDLLADRRESGAVEGKISVAEEHPTEVLTDLDLWGRLDSLFVVLDALGVPADQRADFLGAYLDDGEDGDCGCDHCGCGEDDDTGDLNFGRGVNPGWYRTDDEAGEENLEDDRDFRTGEGLSVSGLFGALSELFPGLKEEWQPYNPFGHADDRPVANSFTEGGDSSTDSGTRRDNGLPKWNPLAGHADSGAGVRVLHLDQDNIFGDLGVSDGDLTETVGEQAGPDVWDTLRDVARHLDGEGASNDEDGGTSSGLQFPALWSVNGISNHGGETGYNYPVESRFMGGNLTLELNTDPDVDGGVIARLYHPDLSAVKIVVPVVPAGDPKWDALADVVAAGGVPEAADVLDAMLDLDGVDPVVYREILETLGGSQFLRLDGLSADNVLIILDSLLVSGGVEVTVSIGAHRWSSPSVAEFCEYVLAHHLVYTLDRVVQLPGWGAQVHLTVG